MQAGVKMNNLLINEYPLMVLPGLAKKIGLNEAIILQQVHYWLKTSAKQRDGKTWTYNTYQDWQKQFPFWSERTIRRTIKNLEDEGYLISGNYNKLAYDKTKWYTIDYEKLNAETVTNTDLSSCGQIDQTVRTNCPDDADKVDRPIPETSTKTSTDNNIESVSPPQASPLNEKKSKREIKRIAFAHNVFLTQKKYDELCKLFGKQNVDKKIIAFSKYQSDPSKKAYDQSQHFRTLKNWLTRDGKPNEQFGKTKQQQEQEELERWLMENGHVAN